MALVEMIYAGKSRLSKLRARVHGRSCDGKCGMRSSLDPKPQTPNPKPQTPNPKPQTPRAISLAAGQTVQTEVGTRGKVVQLLSVTSFATTLDAADRLTLEEQEELADTLRHRITEKRRAELVAAVKESRTEFARGDCKPVSVGASMQRIRA